MQVMLPIMRRLKLLIIVFRSFCRKISIEKILRKVQGERITFFVFSFLQQETKHCLESNDIPGCWGEDSNQSEGRQPNADNLQGHDPRKTSRCLYQNHHEYILLHWRLCFPP